MRALISFPNPLNEKAARIVAAVVLVISLLALATGWYWLAAVLAYGFVARSLSGPKLSPLGWLASRQIAPRLGPAKPVPGPPKRFAQSIGALLGSAAAILALVAGEHVAAAILLALLALAAGLEAIFAFCLGCTIFAALMRLGLIPAEVCTQCANIWATRQGASA
jgi:hypothetical protein